MFGRLFDSPVHLTILIVLIVVVFGWKRLPDATRSVGRSMRILKSEVSQMKSDTESAASAAASETVDGEVAPPADGDATTTASSPSGERYTSTPRQPESRDHEMSA